MTALPPIVRPVTGQDVAWAYDALEEAIAGEAPLEKRDLLRKRLKVVHAYWRIDRRTSSSMPTDVGTESAINKEILSSSLSEATKADGIPSSPLSLSAGCVMTT